MLVLSRHRDEEVFIDFGGVRVVVKIIDVRGDKVRLGFDAPQDVRVMRRELLEAVPPRVVSTRVTTKPPGERK